MPYSFSLFRLTYLVAPLQPWIKTSWFMHVCNLSRGDWVDNQAYGRMAHREIFERKHLNLKHLSDWVHLKLVRVEYGFETCCLLTDAYLCDICSFYLFLRPNHNLNAWFWISFYFWKLYCVNYWNWLRKLVI